MPATVKKEGKKFRVVEADGSGTLNNAAGSAVDGGGHDTYSAALKQAQAINISQHKKNHRGKVGGLGGLNGK
jgi:hypothetical protein